MARSGWARDNARETEKGVRDMTIAVGDRLPEVTLYEMTGDGPSAVASAEVDGKTV